MSILPIHLLIRTFGTICLKINADEFFDESRDHLVQELFGPEDEFSSILTSSFLKMPPTVIKAW